MRTAAEVKRLGLPILVLLLGSFSGAGADCYIDSTAGYVGFWRAWEPGWCGEVEETVEAAFNYWDIGDETGELVIRREGLLTDTPEIRLSDLEDELSGKRVALLSTHGEDPLWAPAGIAVEYYATLQSVYSACSTYCAGTYDWNELRVGQTSSGAYIVGVTNEGIANHLSERLEILDAMVYGDYCYSEATKDAWSVATFVGYEYGPYTCCHNLDKVWTRLACGAYPWHGHQIDDALRYLTEIHCWGVNQKNQLDCTRGCRDMDPAARLGSQWVYREGEEVIIGWHAEAELDTREYLIEAGNGSTWEPIAVVARGDMVAPQVYTVRVGSGYKYYRVVELDLYGQRCGFHPMSPAEDAPWFLADLMEAATGFDEMELKHKSPAASCAPGGGISIEDAPEGIPDWVFYGPDSLLAECGPAVGWFESEGLVVDTVWATSPDH